MSKCPAILLIIIAALLVTPLRAEPPATQPTTESASRASTQPSDDTAVHTEHEMMIGGQSLKYTATAGEMPIKDDAGKVRAKVFFVAYEKEAATSQPSDPSTRPITFVFNGGPGAASVWLHLGAVGPRRVRLGEAGFPPAPPYGLTDNGDSWLDLSDLVFIDPVGTGYSRASDPDKAKEFYNVQGDIESVADFIRLYCTKYRRWLSPKFLAGESYGTTRAAGLSEYLHDRYGTDLNGIVLIGTVLNFQTLHFDAGNDTPYPLYLPTYAAIAHYHKKLNPTLQADLKKTVAEVQKWAMTDYAAALAKGTSLDDVARREVVLKLAAYTGLPESYIERSDLRIEPEHFEKMLLADERKIIGRFDGRVTGFDANPLGDRPEFDPSLDGYLGVFSTTLNDYVRRELKYENEATYEVLSPRVRPWDFGQADGYLNVATTLRRAMTENPALKILVCCGYYDLATPFAAADYTVNAMPLNKPLRANIRETYYEAGHMLYLNPAALEKLKSDVQDFYESAIP